MKYEPNFPGTKKKLGPANQDSRICMNHSESNHIGPNNFPRERERGPKRNRPDQSFKEVKKKIINDFHQCKPKYTHRKIIR